MHKIIHIYLKFLIRFLYIHNTHTNIYDHQDPVSEKKEKLRLPSIVSELKYFSIILLEFL